MPRHHMGDVRKGVMVTSAMAMTAVLASAGVASAAVPTVESTSERVLQSVNVTMGPDGTTTAVDSSVVRTDGTAEDAEASDDSFSPSDVVGDLPVRVLTSWRTADGAGTDLSDLQGYTGRVAIDLTIQNLTVTPQILTYDAAGTSRQQAALVGSPLTVVASTALGDVKADRLVSDDEGTGVNVTNGVIGKGPDGTTVQWAALLAPPTLSATSEFSLVLNAKDFDVPSFDLSVQPGLVTDPSMGALVDAAFNPASSDELDLQRRTIELIGEVNGVLARASDTISDVRTSLTSSAETLGTQTVADLQSSTQSVTTNMSSLGSALQGLQGDLSSTLESTGSSAVAELQQAVTVVDGLLGDTSQGVPTVAVNGSGCRTSVADPRQAPSVYGNLLQVASQLDGYARATDSCKAALQESIVRQIGPDPSQVDDMDEVCDREDDQQPSVTCSIYGTQDDFSAAANELQVALIGVEGSTDEDEQGVLGLIKPALYEEAVSAAQGLMQVATGNGDDTYESIEDLTTKINQRRNVMVAAIDAAYYDLRDGGPLDTYLDTVTASVEEVSTDTESVLGLLEALETKRESASDEVCDLVKDGSLDENLIPATLAYLEEDCQPGPPSTSSLEQAIDTLEDMASDADEAAADAQELRAELFEKVELAWSTTSDLAPELPVEEDERETLRALFRRLIGNPDIEGDGKFEELADRSAELDEAIGDLGDLVGTVADIEEQVKEGIAEAKANVTGGVAGGIDNVLAARDRTNAELEDSFAASVNGMRNAGRDVVRNGKKSVNQQKSSFFTAQEQAANRVTQTVKDGLGQINSGVNASTRDMEAATTLLVADLRKVLLDLGQREIGGAGLLGSMATNAATARQADYQLALAGSTASAYANVRDRDIAGLMLRQEQTDAAMDSLTRLPAFQLELPSGSQHRTVYSFSIEDN